MKAGVSGDLVLQFDVNCSGVPINIKVVEATPKGYFEAEGISALKQWRYMVNLDLRLSRDRPLYAALHIDKFARLVDEANVS
ncbi:hypothetical protein CW748_15140 [Alteromonadales bacterium alter-6D02]|nr:hypothetical protein CW748_15140 [Alteromonadales bacterium alter-6D02]